jgi:hypothetical protein
MSPSIAVRKDDRLARDWTRESVSEIAASMASRLARSREGGGAVFVDDPDREVLAANEPSYACEGAQLDERSAPKLVTLQTPQEGPSKSKLSTDEYRGRVDVCLHWAREASTDEVRLACLNLAQAWLRAAVREEVDASEPLPLAPRL